MVFCSVLATPVPVCMCAPSTLQWQRLCLLPNGLIEPNTDSLRNGMEGAPGGSLCDIPFSLPSQLLLRFDWTKFSPPHSHALTLSTLIYFKRGFFYSLILHRRFSSLIFFSACHFVILSPLMHVAQLIWNAWVSGTDIWTVLCGRLFVALMRRVSFGMSKRMHPTE